MGTSWINGAICILYAAVNVETITLVKLISEAEYQLVEKKLKKDYGVISNITA